MEIPPTQMEIPPIQMEIMEIPPVQMEIMEIPPVQMEIPPVQMEIPPTQMEIPAAILAATQIEIPATTQMEIAAGTQMEIAAGTQMEITRTSWIKEGHCKLEENEILTSGTGRYKVLKLLGKGTFGQVVSCLKIGKNELVACKIFKRTRYSENQSENEFRILRKFNEENPDEFNIIRMYESFYHKKHRCLVLEKLEQNLHDYVKDKKYKPMPLKCIHPILQQVLTALLKLKQLRLIHGDLKPENIMLVDPGDQTFHVKVIDFGTAGCASISAVSKELQSLYYRAPEILLGLPFCEGIDMWSLGCIIAELFLGTPLYPGSCEYRQISYICHTQSLPADHLLETGLKSKLFFKLKEGIWSLKSPDEANVSDPDSRTFVFECIEQITEMYMPEFSDRSEFLAELANRKEFTDLLKKMLTLDGTHRITPFKALNHNFVTADHLKDYAHCSNVQKSSLMMEENKLNNPKQHSAQPQVGTVCTKQSEAAAARANPPQQAAQSCISYRYASSPRMYPLAKFDDIVLQAANQIQPIRLNPCFPQPQVATKYEVSSVETNPALSCLPSSCSGHEKCIAYLGYLIKQDVAAIKLRAHQIKPTLLNQRIAEPQIGTVAKQNEAAAAAAGANTPQQTGLNSLTVQDSPVLEAAQALPIKPTLLNLKNSQVCSADENRVSQSLLPVIPLEVKDNHPCKNAPMQQHSPTQSIIEIVDLVSDSERNSSPDFSEKRKLIEMPDPRERGSYIKVNWNYAYLKDCDLNPYVDMGERVSCFRCNSPLPECSNEKTKVEVLDLLEKEKVKCGASESIFLKNCDLNPYVDMGERVQFSNQEIGIFIKDASKEVPVKENERKIGNLSSLKKTSVKIDGFQVAEKSTSEILPDKKRISSGTKGDVPTGKAAIAGKTTKRKRKLCPKSLSKRLPDKKKIISGTKIVSNGKAAKGKQSKVLPQQGQEPLQQQGPEALPQQGPVVVPQQTPKDFEKDFKKEKKHIFSPKGRE